MSKIKKTIKTIKTIKTKRKKTKKNTKKINKFQKGGALIVIIPNTGEYKLTNCERKVNGFNIFSIEYNGCVIHFKLLQRDMNFKFLYLEIDSDRGVLIPRVENSDTAEINEIKRAFQDNQSQTKNPGFLYYKKTISIKFNESECEHEIVISQDSKDKITELNALLINKCPGMTLSLDYIYNMKGNVVSYSDSIHTLVLCLNNNYGCVSSIEINIEDRPEGKVLIIGSKTKENYQGKKYNKLLRSAIIIIGPLLGCVNLESHSVNPISAWTLMKSFSATATSEELINFITDERELSCAQADELACRALCQQDAKLVSTELESVTATREEPSQLVSTELESVTVTREESSQLVSSELEFANRIFSVTSCEIEQIITKEMVSWPIIKKFYEEIKFPMMILNMDLTKQEIIDNALKVFNELLQSTPEEEIICD